MIDRASRAFALAFLVLVLAFAGWLRFAGLGQHEFNGDELDHVYAASSLETTGEPLLPSGERYDRALDYTRLVGATSDWFEDPETGARFVSALLGWLAVVAMAAIGWWTWGPWAGVFSALLMAIFPEAVAQSRQTRFYTYQLLCCLGAFAAGWMCVRSDPTRPLKRWLWLAVASVAFWLAYRVQLTTLSVMAGWTLGLGVIGLADHRRGVAWRRNVPLLFATGVLMAGSLAVLARPGLVDWAIRRATFLPAWADRSADPRLYFWSLNGALPLLTALTPLALLVVGRRKPRLAVYAGAWFGVAFLLHSFLFTWRGDRYLLSAMPGLLLIGGSAAAAGLSALFRWLREILPAALAGGAVAIVVLSVLATTPAFDDSLRLPSHRPLTLWTRADELIERVPGDPWVASSVALPALYYWGDLDAVVGSDFLEHPGSAGARRLPEGTPDWYGGIPVLTRPETLRAAAGGRDLLVAIDRGRWDFGNITPELRAWLSRSGREVCQAACGHLYLFHVPAGSE